MKKVARVLSKLWFLAVIATISVNSLFASLASAEQQATIKDPAESRTYANALNSGGDEWNKAAALEAFLAKYPNTVVKASALQELMSSYRMTGNSLKTEETAKRLIVVDDSNVDALMVVTVFSRTHVIEANLNLDDLCASSQRGIAVAPNWQKPQDVPEANFGNMKKGAARIFYGGAGLCALKKKDFDVARQNYLKALAIGPDDMIDNYQLSIAELESTPMNPDGFWYLAKAIRIANEQQSPIITGMNQFGAAMYKKQNGSEDGWASFLIATMKSAPPASAQDVSDKKGPSDAEIACKAMKENSIQELSFGDLEFVLKQRDAGACNIEAADQVWTFIQDMTKHGTLPVKLPVKVISSSSTKINVALTEENQQANQVDLVVTMESPMQNPPGNGATITISGVFTGYQLNPFYFSMAQGKLASAEPGAN